MVWRDVVMWRDVVGFSGERDEQHTKKKLLRLTEY